MKKHNILLILIASTMMIVVGCTNDKQQIINDNKIDLKKAALLNVELGRSYLVGGYTERAKRKFIHALKLMPNSAEVHSGMGYFWETVKEHKEAEKHYRRSIALGHGKGEFHNQYALFLCSQDRYKEANKHFLIAINDKLYDQTAQIYANAGSCSLKNTDYTVAENYFIKGLDHDPRKTELLLELAKIALHTTKLQAAEGYLQKFYTTNDNKPTPEYLLLGIKVAKLLGQEDIAISKAMALKNLFPDSIEYKVYNNDNINKAENNG